MVCERITELHQFTDEMGLQGSKAVIETGRKETNEMIIRAGIQQRVIDLAEHVICRNCPLNKKCSILSTNEYFTRRPLQTSRRRF